MASENETIERITREKCRVEYRKSVGNSAAHAMTLDEAIAHAEDVAGKCDTSCKRDHRQLADWLKELRDVKRTPVGNAAALREALMRIKHLFHNINLCEDTLGNEAYAIADAALSAPPRQCDVGTPEEQVQRMTDAFCMKQWEDGLIRCSLCPISCTNGRRTCTLTWAQMPYEAEEGGAK